MGYTGGDWRGPERLHRGNPWGFVKYDWVLLRQVWRIMVEGEKSWDSSNEEQGGLAEVEEGSALLDKSK